jgi:tRNA nucleotidyltransferase (CCA-adding enzyme)
MSLSVFLQENLPFDLNLLPQNAYLVGGAVRDILLQRQREYLDLDFVLPQDAIKIAKKIASICNAGFVILDQQRNIARVVFKQVTVDFAQQEGETLLQDLQRRDFTINAIAYNFYTDELIDPLNGKKDIEKKVIKMISENNLKDDPLRLLRAYRQASQLNFTIENHTRFTLQKLAPLLSQIAAERIRTEFNYLLTNSNGSKWLKEAYNDGLLSVWLKNLSLNKVENLTKIDESANWLKENYREFKQQSESWYYLVKLANLMSENYEIAEEELVNLKYSRAEIRSVITVLKYLPEILNANSEITLRQQYFFFLNVGENFSLIAILAIARGIKKELISYLIDNYLDANNSVAHPQAIITGNDLINKLKIPPSPKIGQLLTELQIAYIEKKIITVEDALNFATDLSKFF